MFVTNLGSVYNYLNWMNRNEIDSSIFHVIYRICLRTRNYASSSSGEAYRDRQLTTNFEIWVEIFCVPTCFHMRIPKPCLSVCPSVHLSVPREKKLPWLRHYQSYISNWYINGKVFTSTTPFKPKNVTFFLKFEIRILTFDEELKSP